MSKRTRIQSLIAVVALTVGLITVSEANAQRYSHPSRFQKPIPFPKRPTPKSRITIQRQSTLHQLKPTLVSKFRPDLYFVGAGDLTDILDKRPMRDKMWFRIGNKGKTTAKNFWVRTYFYTIVTASNGKPRGKVKRTRSYWVSQLKPGTTRKFYPLKVSNPPKVGIRWAVNVDTTNRVPEMREDNNKSGRMWTTYPDAFLRQIPFDPVP
ncbi:MAG: hypothetical protein ACFCD0_11250 [Gemmataceae bacterium]